MKRVFFLSLVILTWGMMAAPVKKSIAPDFSLTDLHGREATLSKFKGKPVLLVFWASWCGPCRREMPLIIEMYHRYHEKGLEILAVAVPARQTYEKVDNFANREGLPFRVLWDEDGKASGDYKVSSIPTNVLISPNGEILSSSHSINNAMIQQIEALLSPPSKSGEKTKKNPPSHHPKK